MHDRSLRKIVGLILRGENKEWFYEGPVKLKAEAIKQIPLQKSNSAPHLSVEARLVLASVSTLIITLCSIPDIYRWEFLLVFLLVYEQRWHLTKNVYSVQRDIKK